MKELLAFIYAIAIYVAFVIIDPIICFALGYIGGMILQLCTGQIIENTLIRLGFVSFSQSAIPVLCGTIFVVGNYFKKTNTNTKEGK